MLKEAYRPDGPDVEIKHRLLLLVIYCTNLYLDISPLINRYTTNTSTTTTTTL